MKTVLTAERKVDLLRRFNELNTLKSRLEFWQFHLPINYIVYHELETGADLYDELKEFSVPIDDSEREAFAKWVLDNYHILSNNPKRYKTLYVFEHLVDSFNSKLEEEENPLEAIQIELLELKEEFTQTVYPDGGLRGIAQIVNSSYSYCFKYNASYKSFEAYKELGSKPKFKNIYPYVYTIIQEQNGYTFGRYWEYLNKLRIAEEAGQSKQDEKATKKKKAITEPQQVLILHYLGLIKPITGLNLNVENRAKLISTLLQTGQENTEKYLNAIGTEKARTYTESNYTFLVDFFEELGLIEIKEECRKVLQKIQGTKGK